MDNRTVIKTRSWKGRQDTNRQDVVREGERVMRYTVHHDTSYDFQSWAKAEVWNGKWRTVHSIPGYEIKSVDSAMKELVSVAGQVLS